MSYKFVLEFRGLCAYVPSHGIEEGKENNLVSVLLVNASAEAKDNFNVSLPEHFPVIRCKLGDLQDVGGGPEDAEVMIRLNGEDVVLAPQTPPSDPLTITLGLRKGAERPNDDQVPDFSWVPQMDDVLTGAGDLIPGLLRPKPVQNRVIARVHLSEGELKTGRVGRFKGIPIVTEFRGEVTPASAEVRRQAIAISAILEVNVEGPVRLLARKFGNNGDEAVRKITFKPADPGKERRVEVLNLCAGALLKRDLVERLDEPEVLKPDTDFGWFYLLSERVRKSGAKLESLPIPKPLISPEEVLRGGDGGSETARCTKTSFKAKPGALAPFRDLVTQLRSL
jgi:hypothetical protein